jgi:hypothetical protein
MQPRQFRSNKRQTRNEKLAPFETMNCPKGPQLSPANHARKPKKKEGRETANVLAVFFCFWGGGLSIVEFSSVENSIVCESSN